MCIKTQKLSLTGPSKELQEGSEKPRRKSQHFCGEGDAFIWEGCRLARKAGCVLNL